MEINHADMVRKLFKNPHGIVMTAQQINLLHAAVGIAGEAGEVYGAARMTIGDDWRRRLLDELGDLEFYLEAAVQHTGVTRVGPRVVLRPHDIEQVRRQAVTIMAEADELLDVVKKYAFNNRTDVEDKVHLALKKILGSVASIYRPLGATRQMALDANIAKLGARYEGFSYSDEAAAARRDEG